MLKYEEDNSSSAVKELKRILEEKGQWQAIKVVKGKLDKINFKGLYSKDVCFNEALDMYLPKMSTKTESKNWAVLKPLEENEIDKGNFVVKKYKEVLENLLAGIYPGTVSNGVHATELIERYFTPEMVKQIDYWNTKKVMVVYEAPANNLDCSYAVLRKCEEDKQGTDISNNIKEYISEKNSQRLLTDNLTGIWWRLNEQLLRQAPKENKKCNPTMNCISNRCYECFNSKSYTGFLLALISHFGLANLYTTNYCRMELFEIDEKNENKESFLNWDKTLNLKNGKEVFMKEENLFLDEYEQFMPDIVLASSNPYNRLQYLINGKKKRNDHDSYDRMQGIIGNTKPRIIKMIHPASRYPYDFRLCYNMCMITRELERIYAIKKERADEIFNHFREMKITDNEANNGENNNENDTI